MLNNADGQADNTTQLLKGTKTGNAKTRMASLKDKVYLNTEIALST